MKKTLLNRLKLKTALSIIYALAACLLVITNITIFLAMQTGNSQANTEGFSSNQFAAKQFDFQYGREGKKDNDDKGKGKGKDDADEKAEKEAAEKAAKEKAEKEAAEKAAKEKAEKEAAEKAAKEKAEKEAAEKAAKEKAEKEAAEKAVEKAEKEAAEKAAEKGTKKVNLNFNNGHFPDGIDIRGTLVLLFEPDVDPDSKIKFDAPLRINPITPEQLDDLDPGDPDTFVSGYSGMRPDVFDASQTAKDSAGNAITPFTMQDDLPALMYNGGIADLHKQVNISGVIYSPVFAEIENKGNTTQYINGAVIGGGGILVQNKGNGKTIIKYNPNTLDRLATDGSNGKTFRVVHRE